MYDAMDIAEYVLSYCENDLGKPITNLQLQKFLYYIQGDYLAKYGLPIFDNTIEAWAYGPVVPDVYYCYNNYSSRKIKGIKPSVEIEKETISSINESIKRIINIQVWDLVDKTHKEDPWSDNYIANQNEEIPIDEIKSYFQK
jgi:uncharacterized phage-associated protein